MTVSYIGTAEGYGDIISGDTNRDGSFFPSFFFFPFFFFLFFSFFLRPQQEMIILGMVIDLAT